MTRKNDWISLIVGYLGSVLGLVVLNIFNRDVLMLLPLSARMITSVAVYWLIALVPTILIIVNKEKFGEYGFSSEKLVKQVIIGIMIGAVMSLVLTVVPHLLGFGEYVSSGKNYTRPWQFVYEFFYCIFAVSFTEELVFRGFIYIKVQNISGKKLAAVIVSSVLFGAFHFLNGGIIQTVVTAFLGVFFCLCRSNIKGCTIVSLIIAHGIYDALITVWTAIL